MVISSFYNTAKSYAEKIKAEMPSVFEKEDFTITLIMAEEDQQIFTGVTTYTISEGNVDTIHSEAIAVMSMIAANKPKAKQMITVSFSDLKVVKPCDECLDMLLGADADNGKCEIAINFSNSETAINLKSQATNISADFLEKNTEEEVSVPDLGAPAEFVSGFEFDADNPFLAESEEAVEEVKTIASEAEKKPVQPDSLQQPPVGGAIYQQQGVYPQGGMFPQGFVQQPGVYQQQGFVQQPGMYQQPGVYQQQGAAPTVPNAYAQGANKSVHISDVISAAHDEKFEPVPAASKYAENTEGVLKQRLATLFEETEDDEGTHNATASKDDLESMAKEMKKNAKTNAKMKNKF